MKKNIFTLALLLAASLSFAQSSGQARQILDKAYAAYEQSKGIGFNFNVSTTGTNGTAYQTQTGKAMIKGNKFKLEMTETDIWFDGKTQWVMMKNAKEVNISNPSNAEIAAISPLSLLGMYKTGYTLKAPISKTINGKNAYAIEMTPTNGNTDFRNVSVAIDKKTNTVLQVITAMKNNTKNLINISNYNANNNFSDATFIFDKTKYPGTEIIDLR